MNKSLLSFIALTLMSGVSALAKQDIEHVFQGRIFPDGQEIVFRWRGDLWKAPVSGGSAIALTQAPSFETNPCISPDGSMIYYLSDRDDTYQIYSYDLATMETRKITSHSEGFYSIRQIFPDGKHLLVYAFRDATGFESGRFYKVSIETGAEELLFNDYGGGGSLSPDGKKLLFTREGNNPNRLHYRGSKATQIWMYDLEKKTFQRMFDCDYSMAEPLWHPNGKSFYYINSKSGIGNIHRYYLGQNIDQPITYFKDASAMGISISARGHMMIFSHMADTYTLDLRNRNARPHKLSLYTDLIEPIPTVKRRYYQTLFNNDSHGSCDFAKNAAELVFTTGGDLFVMDTILKEPIAICNTTALHEREAFFSKDYQSIYILRDDGKSVNIWTAERQCPNKAWWENREFKLTQITNDNETRYNLSMSPDGQSLVWAEDRGRLVISDSKGENRRVLAETPYKMEGYSWSPDSKWIVAALRDSDDNMDVWILSTTGERKPFNLSRHPNFDYAPTWSPDGKVISFIGHRYDSSIKLYYVYLNPHDEIRDGNSYVERLDEARKKYYQQMNIPLPETKAGQSCAVAMKKEEKKADSTTVVIDFEDLETRIRAINTPTNDPQYPFWSPDGKKLAFVATINGKRATWKVEFPFKINQPELLFNETGYMAEWLPDGRVAWCINSVPAINNQLLNFKAYQETNLKDYQRLAFRMAWRGMRDNLYDPLMKNINWEEVLKRYEEKAVNAVDQETFTYLVTLSQSELNASHLGFMPNREPRQAFNNWSVITAHLGLFFDANYKGEGLKVSQVLRNGPTNIAPNFVNKGDILLKIDDVAVDQTTNLIPLLTKESTWNFKLLLKRENGQLEEMFVPSTTYGKIRNLMNQERLRNNKKMVDQLSRHKIGYLNIAQMNKSSLHQFEHDVYATTFDRDALIIDVRNNQGGHISDFLLSMLCHPQHAITIPRHGERSYPYGYLGKSIYHKPLVVLCNQNTCSNAEIFSHAIKTLKRGKIIGVPSQACVISTPRMKILDLGEMATPDRGWWTIDGIDMDLQGVIPDIIIWPQPEEIPNGIDHQLEKAVEVLLEEIKENEQIPETNLIWARDGYKAIKKKTAQETNIKK